MRSRALGPCKLPQEALVAGDAATTARVIGDPVWPQQPEAWENGGGASLVLCHSPSSGPSADGGHSWSLAVVPSDPAPSCISSHRGSKSRCERIKPSLLVFIKPTPYMPFSHESLCAADMWGEGRQAETQ